MLTIRPVFGWMRKVNYTGYRLLIGKSLYSTRGFCCRDEDGYHLVWKLGTLSVGYNYQKYNDEPYFEGDIPAKYVHELLHALRLLRFNDLADNFKI